MMTAATTTTSLVILVFLALRPVDLRPPSSSSQDKKGLSLEDLLAGKYYSRAFNGSFLNDNNGDGSGTAVLQWLSEDSGDVVLLDLTTRRKEVLIKGDEILNGVGTRSHLVRVSPSRSHALVGYNPQRVFRHSLVANYALIDLHNNSTRQFTPVVVTGTEDEGGEGHHHHQGIQLVKWSPKSSAFAYVRNNDLFYSQLGGGGGNKKVITTQVTHTGSHVVFNGVTDWVYEEEMYSSNEALWFSGRDGGRYLAYVTFNDTLVDVVHYPLYGEPGMLQYPLQETLPYPKAGRSNPTARVHVFDTEKLTTRPLLLPSPFNDDDSLYVSWVGWDDGDDSSSSPPLLLLVTLLNRFQNESWTFSCPQHGDDVTPPCSLLRMVVESSGWLDVVPIHNVPTAAGGAGGVRSYVTLESTFDVDAKYRHAVLFNSDSVERQLTLGQFNVDKIVHVNNNTLWFTSGLVDVTTGSTRLLIDPAQSHLYSVSFDGDGDHDSTMTCHTCDDHQDCPYNDILAPPPSSSSSAQQKLFYVRTCSNPDLHVVPTTDARPFTTTSSDNDKSAAAQAPLLLESNEALKRRLEGLNLPRMKRLSMRIPGTPFNASIVLWLPHDLDEEHSSSSSSSSSKKKYPLLVDVYGGPGSQRVTLKSSLDWGMTLVSSSDVIYASIDGRGSGRVSDSQMFAVYKSLGRFEVDDQISGIEFILKNLPYVDKDNVAIWGWSYGGYVTAMVLGRDTRNIVKCGVSVAPVTSWAFYDTIYTERYMGQPENNFAAYNRSDVTNYVGNFRGKQFLLVHGTADDNVHYQQSMVLARALETNDVLFQSQSYPDEAHGLGGVRPHLYHTIQHFLLNLCFKKQYN